MEAEVQLAIAGAGKSVTDHVAGGHFDRGGAGVAGERGPRPEPANVTDAAKDFARGQCAEAVQVGEGGDGCGHSGLNIGGSLGDPAVQLAHLTDQIHRECTQRLAGGIAGSHPAQEFGGVIGA